jgi:hypothetical protein
MKKLILSLSIILISLSSCKMEEEKFEPKVDEYRIEQSYIRENGSDIITTEISYCDHYDEDLFMYKYETIYKNKITVHPDSVKFYKNEEMNLANQFVENHK